MAAAVNKRTSDSKYVTLLADSRHHVHEFLDRSTSDYMVGVDNMTVCSAALSMIEPIDATNHTEILRVVRKPIAVSNPSRPPSRIRAFQSTPARPPTYGKGTSRSKRT